MRATGSLLPGALFGPVYEGDMRMMRKNLLSLSVASAIAFAGMSTPTWAIDMQSRTALANCLIEAAVSITATIATHKDVCEEGEWDLEVIVDEWIASKIPIQGSLFVSGDDAGYELNGKMAAVFNPLLNDVNCRVDTVDVGSTFAGVPFVYSGGDDTLYPDALTDKNDPLLDVSTFLSEGNVTIQERPRIRLKEEDILIWANGPEETFMATGEVEVLGRRGQNDVVISTWVTEDEDEVYGWIEYIPDVEDPFDPDEILEGYVKAEFVTDDLYVGECEIEIEAEALISPYVLDIVGTLKIEAEDE